MTAIKPILFNTDMVRALLDNRKTVTRRVVKPRYCDSVLEIFRGELCEASPYKPPRDNGDGTTTRFVRQFVPCEPPYRPGDILYVRETWTHTCIHCENYPMLFCPTDCGTCPEFVYKADGGTLEGWPYKRWRPSIHMPREAARIFLRVTNVRVERLQEITEGQARAEGVSPVMVTTDVEKPDSEKEWHEWGSALPGFIGLWDSTIKPADRALYGWGANPWVWVIEFERISKKGAAP